MNDLTIVTMTTLLLSDKAKIRHRRIGQVRIRVLLSIWMYKENNSEHQSAIEWQLNGDETEKSREDRKAGNNLGL